MPPRRRRVVPATDGAIMSRGELELRAACKHCETTLVLTAADVLILSPTDRARPVTVAYECDRCGRSSAVVIDPVMAAVLEEEGAVTIRNHPSLRAPARSPVEAHPDGPRLTYDDLLDLHQELQQLDWFEHVVRLTMTG